MKTQIILAENQRVPAKAKVSITEKEVLAQFEKNDLFRDIVKGLRFSWDGDKRAWAATAILTDTLEDVACELAAALLLERYSVEVPETIVPKLVAGDWKPCVKRYVTKSKDGDIFLLRWFGRNEALYHAARCIKGSRWAAPYVSAPSSSWLDVTTLADKHGFVFSPVALAMIEAEKEKQASAITINLDALRKPKIEKPKAEGEVALIPDLIDA